MATAPSRGERHRPTDGPALHQAAQEAADPAGEAAEQTADPGQQAADRTSQTT